MNRKLFNFKNAAVAVVFSLVAFIGFNSFKSVPVKSVPVKRVITSPFLVNKGTSGFQQRASVALSGCSVTSTLNCVYDVKLAGMINIPNKPSYTPAEISLYAANGWIAPRSGSSLAEYAF